MKILMILTSHDELGDTGKKTGFWLEEFAAPYYVFRDAGAEITLASPKGANRRSILKAMRPMRRLRQPTGSKTTSMRRPNSPARTRCPISTSRRTTRFFILADTDLYGIWPRTIIRLRSSKQPLRLGSR